MNKFFAIALLGIVALAGAAPVQADMTYAPFLFDGYDENGDPIENGTYTMIIDLDGDGWDGVSYLEQGPADAANDLSWLWDSDDFLMDIGQIEDGEAFPFSTIPTADIPAGYDAEVDQYYLFWFNTPFDVAAGGPGQGIYYGAESLGTVGTDPGNYGPFALGGDATLQTTVVPEPISATLALMGGGAMFLRRRRRSKAAKAKA